MEAEKSFDLPIYKLEAQGTGGVVLVQTPWFESQGADGICSAPRAKEDLLSSSSSQGERAISPFFSSFVMFTPPRDWMRLSHLEENDCLYSVYQFKR